MANAVVARIQGDDYQARFFWIAACRLFTDETKVIKVGYDLEPPGAPKAFDDVVIWYSTPISNGHGRTIQADYWQIKYHVNHAGALTYETLIDPAATGAKSLSFLQRLKDAQERYAPRGDGARFSLFSPWQIDPTDALAKIVGINGEIRMHILFDATGCNSQMGKVRELWKVHLGISNDDQLKTLLSTLCIKTGEGGLHSLYDKLNDKLQIAGLKPVAADQSIHHYDELIKKLRVQGRTEFTRQDIQEACVIEGLWVGQTTAKPSEVQVGLRSFWRWAENMEDETAHMLCLLDHFDSRQVKHPQAWKDDVFPKLQQFLSQTMRPEAAYHLHIDAHGSIAFAAGYCLDSKSGVRVFPVQKTKTGKIVWDCDAPTPGRSYKPWKIIDKIVNTTGSEVAVAICGTHDIFTDVEIYVNENLPDVGRIFVFSADPPNPRALSDGYHAAQLAQEVSTALKAKRTVAERKARLHIFSAAPNGLLFFLGQCAHGFGQFTLYEHDLESGIPGAYQPSLKFPPPADVSLSMRPVTR